MLTRLRGRAALALALLTLALLAALVAAPADAQHARPQFTRAAHLHVHGITLINPKHLRVNLHPDPGPLLSMSDYTTTPDANHPACERDNAQADLRSSFPAPPWPDATVFEAGHTFGIKCFADQTTGQAYERGNGEHWLATAYGQQNFGGYTVGYWTMINSGPNGIQCTSDNTFTGDDRADENYSGDFFFDNIASIQLNAADPSSGGDGCYHAAIYDWAPYNWEEAQAERQHFWGHRYIIDAIGTSKLWVASFGSFAARCGDQGVTNNVGNHNAVVEIADADTDLPFAMNPNCQ